MENKTESKRTFSWFIFWLAGFMFTVGYVGIPIEYFTLNFGEKITSWIFAYLLWPLTLGMSLAGNTLVIP